MKIGFIGTGNLMGAIVNGLIRSGYCKPGDILCSDALVEKREQFARETGTVACQSNRELAELADMVVLTVKPQIVPLVLDEIKDVLVERRPLLLSAASSVTLGELEGSTGSSGVVPIVRVMTNVNTAICNGISAICPNPTVTPEQRKLVIDVLDAIGATVEIGERDFDKFTVVGCATPAFVYMFIDAMARGGVKIGLAKPLATKIAAQAALGSIMLVMESGEHPGALIDQVCSPAGSTIEGILKLEENAFTGTVMDAVNASYEKIARNLAN